MPEIEHFFAPVSGYAYLGHDALLRLARDNGLRVRQRPVDIAKVFEAGGSTPPVKQSEARRAWRTLDMRRWAERRRLPLQDGPRFWPVDGALAARAIIALQALDGPADQFAGAVLSAVWARDLDISDASTVSALLRDCGAEPGIVLVCAESAEIRAAYEANTVDAIAAGAFGSPTYRVGHEIFFGQDRLEFVQAALKDAPCA